MKKIGLLSDTHNYLHPKIFDFFRNCEEIWHAGDIGGVEIINKLKGFKFFRAVYGNIDDQYIRFEYPKIDVFDCEKVKVLMTHIGGYPNRYNPHIKKKIEAIKPQIFISGHSHILKIIYDKKYNLLHINPGAAGKYGFHQKITFLRFNIDGEEIKNLEIFESDK